MGRRFLLLLSFWLGVLPYGRAANIKKPDGYENSPGSNQYQGVSGSDAIVVPNVVGRVANAEDMQRFLKGSGFQIKIVRYEASETMPEGMIISQTPGALTEVKAKGTIRVVVSTGIPKPRN